MVALGLLLLGARVLAALLMAAGPLSFLQPSTTSAGYVGSVVRQHAGQWEPAADPLVSVGDVQVKSSNVYGVDIDNVRYYYHFTQTFSYDPLGRGEEHPYRLVMVLDPGGPFEAEVYRID